MVTIALGATSALADPDPVDLSVVDRDTGQVLPIWRHDGRLFVAGEPGARYGLRITNHTGDRVLVVLSVDGVNVITGQTAGYDQKGYVLYPYQSDDITGWRKSNTEVAAFTFAPLPQSYAARTGRPADVGVIGMAVFGERPSFVVPLTLAPAPAAPPTILVRPIIVPTPPSPAPAPAPMGPRAAPAETLAGPLQGRIASREDEPLGTAHGAREWSVANVVRFVRATPYPISVRQIEYDTYGHLVARGVIPRPDEDGRRPRAFPARPGEGGYVPDPPGGP